MKTPSNRKSNTAPLFLAASIILFLGSWFVKASIPEPMWVALSVVGLSFVCFAIFIYQSRKIWTSRAGAFGLQSFVSALIIILIVGLINFVAGRYPKKFDLTKNKIHTLSDQTTKILKNLPGDVRFDVYAKMERLAELKPLIENYKGYNPKLKVEYVNPDHEINRVKQAGIKRDGTIVIHFGTRDSKVEDPTEEKLTNALIKILKEKNRTLCVTTGHGEKNFMGDDAEGYSQVRKELGQQSYDVKEINLFTVDRVPPECDAVAIAGSSRAFFPKEIQELNDYFSAGGRGVVAIDFNLKTPEPSPELAQFLKSFSIGSKTNLIVDPVAKMVNVEPVVSVISSFSKDHSITKDFQASCFLPFARPLEILQGAPATLKLTAFAKTMPTSWAETDNAELKSGAVKFNSGKDIKGPHDIAIAVEGKLSDSKAQKELRLVVFGTSAFATNYWARYGGNLDLFLNSVSWVLEDESLISIRAKDEEPGRIEMTQNQSTIIGLLTIFVIPLLTASAGIVIWYRRRKL